MLADQLQEYSLTSDYPHRSVSHNLLNLAIVIGQFSIDLSTRPWGITGEFVVFITRALCSGLGIVLPWILIYQNWSRVDKNNVVSQSVRYESHGHGLIVLWIASYPVSQIFDSYKQPVCMGQLLRILIDKSIFPRIWMFPKGKLREKLGFEEN